MELMPEDILQGNKSEVDSTTDIDSPIKKRKVTQSKPKRKRAKSAVSAHIQAAKKRKYDQLANMELTSKDMLQGDESEVDSTTDIDSPVKKRKVTQNNLHLSRARVLFQHGSRQQRNEQPRYSARLPVAVTMR